MREVLPEFLEPLLLAGREVSLTGRLPLSGMQRLREQLLTADGDATVELHFGRDSGGRVTVTGRVAAELELTCQRCMRPYRHRLDNPVALAVVAEGEKDDHLPEGFEPLNMEGETLATVALVEDELLLGLPLVAMHPDEGCNRELARWQQEETPRENPFSVLENMKVKRQRH